MVHGKTNLEDSVNHESVRQWTPPCSPQFQVTTDCIGSSNIFKPTLGEILPANYASVICVSCFDMFVEAIAPG